jgi:hypothetical protein
MVILSSLTSPRSVTAAGPVDALRFSAFYCSIVTEARI